MVAVMNNNPIGIFDSGLGGLSVWREVRRLMPGESLLYFADGKNCPYGTKPVEDIRRYTAAAIDWLAGEGAKLIVIACNTATTAAIGMLREKYPAIPFVGVEPAVKPAVENTKTGVVGVLATEASLKGKMYRKTSEKYGDSVTILSVPGNGFVELVEGNKEGTGEALKTVRKVIDPVIKGGADQLVLGCTHYPFLAADIRRVIGGEDIKMIDSSPAVARRVKELLVSGGLLSGEDNVPEYRFHTLAGEDYMKKLIVKAEKAMDMEF